LLLSVNKLVLDRCDEVCNPDMLHNFEDVTDKTIINADICIIGSGVAGLTIANEFIGSRYKVVVLEGGGKKDETRSQKLYDADVVGMAHDGIHNGSGPHSSPPPWVSGPIKAAR